MTDCTGSSLGEDRRIKCTVMLPMLDQKDSTSAIFRLFESQNKLINIKTDKWTLVGREECNPCKPSEMAPVQGVLDNEVLTLYIDQRSKEVLERVCFKMKYKIWNVQFKFD